jgi:hypothetical protein
VIVRNSGGCSPLFEDRWKMGHYLKFNKAEDRDAYYGKKLIPIETFQEKYFDGEVELNGDMLEILEWRHDWSKPRFTLGLIKHLCVVAHCNISIRL